MKKYHVDCSHCDLNISMLLSRRPNKCPKCKEYFNFDDVDDGIQKQNGIQVSDSFVSGGKGYIHAEGDFFIKTHNDVVLGVDTVVTAIKGAKVEMNNPLINKIPNYPNALSYKEIKIDAVYVFILQKIVNDIIGVGRTLSMTQDETKQFFRVVQNRICNGMVDGLNGGSLTAIRSFYYDYVKEIIIINTNDDLTDEGVELLKFIANKITEA